MHVPITIVGIVGPVLQLALAIVMVLRKLHRQFPFFFAYTLFSIIVIGPRIAASNNPAWSFGVYWTTEIVFGVLALLVIREAFKLELETISEQYKWLRFFPAFILLLITLIALWRVLYHSFGPGRLGLLGTGAYVFTSGMRIVEIAALLLAVELARLNLSLDRREHAIVEGFGTAAAVNLLAHLLRAWLGPRFDKGFMFLPPGAYFMATLIWLTAFCRCFPPPKPVDRERIDRTIKFLQRRTRAIRRLNKSLSASP